MGTETSGHDSTEQGDTRELVERLRSAPAEEVLAELFSTLLSTAQVKLGRRDARLFIDLCALLSEHAEPFLPGELSKQVESALGQLRLAQVAAEIEVARKTEPEPHDLKRAPAPPTTRGSADAGSGDP